MLALHGHVAGGVSGRATLLATLDAATFIYQDIWPAVALCCLCGLLALPTVPWPRLAPPVRLGMWFTYLLAAAYTAFNVPVANVLGTPLTAPMLEAAGGELKDSVAVYATASHLAAVALLAAAALVLPWILVRLIGTRQFSARPTRVAVLLAGLVLVTTGPILPADQSTGGRNHNALFTLAATEWLQWSGAAALAPPPAELPVEGEGRDLTGLRGAGKGWNVVWIVLESTAAQYLAPYGATPDPMPNLTALARNAVVFDHAYTAYPESIKNLFALLCAAEPAAYTAPGRYAEDRHPCPSVAARFHEAGYRTALVHSGRFVYLGMEDLLRNRGFDELHDAGSIGGRYASSFGTDEGSAVARILDFVDAGARPFFVMYVNIAGHHPYETPGDGPRPFGEDDDFHRYLSDLYMGDAALGQLVDGVRARGMADTTLWVVQGDHGEAFYQHPGNLAHSLYIYEENVHIPLIVALPGRLRQAIHAPQLASAVHVAPTILDLAGLPIPDAYQGRSLLTGEPRVARFFTDHTTWQVGLRQSHWKFILELGSNFGQLYDLSTDPGEQHNLAASQPDRVARYSEHLRQWSVYQRAWVLNGGSR